MRDLDDRDRCLGIVDFVQDSIQSLSNSVLVVARELFRARRPRVLSKASNSGNYFGYVAYRQVVKFFDGRLANANFVVSHDALSLVTLSRMVLSALWISLGMQRCLLRLPKDLLVPLR